MKTVRDVEKKLMAEILAAFDRQMKDLYLAQYLYYRQSTVDKDGDVQFAEECPEGWFLADGNRFPRNATKEQIFSQYYHSMMQLPIMSILDNVNA